jgi:formylglycine-generating enzyme required for sulfatase activity
MAQRTRDDGMIDVAGGTFVAGSDRHYPEEAPRRTVTIAPFQLDETPVTNAQFADFVAATGYVTFVEKAPDPASYPGLVPEMAVAGSIVFAAPDRGQRLEPESWWSYVAGAHWRCPYGPDVPGTLIADHPVVHIAYEDALAYARWAGKRLPSEDELEYAARAGQADSEYAWGNDLLPAGRAPANFWYDGFPHQHPEKAGPPYTTPVRQYPANRWGLHDLIGNIWEWTASDAAGPPGNTGCCIAPADLALRGLQHRKVLKGGSHLCAPNYCRRYRPAAKWLQPVDTATSHIGFRCAR